MSSSHPDPRAQASREELMSALFVQMVVQQSNMALMFLGKLPNPSDGRTLDDIPSAKLFIDQLEMIEFKTRGNLTPEEEKLLKQTLTALRIAFVEAIEYQHQKPPAATSPDEPPASSPQPTPPEPPPEEESRKRFSKKY
jgi:hypothetical protein